MVLGENCNASPLVVGDYYSRKDLATLLKSPFIEKSQSGVLQFDNCILLLVDLDKSKEYGNRFEGDLFFMNFQNSSTQESKSVQRFKDGDLTYLFVRKQRLIKNTTQPYEFKGQLVLESLQGEKPVSLLWRLLNTSA